MRQVRSGAAGAWVRLVRSQHAAAPLHLTHLVAADAPTAIRSIIARPFLSCWQIHEETRVHATTHNPSILNPIHNP
jgi:hypothetical protein